jgi:hypothetical protein
MPGVNDANEETPEDETTLFHRAQKDAQSWSHLLYGSGGSLEVTKCFTYMIFHDWKTGRPTLRKPESITEKVILTDCYSGEAIPLPIIDPDIGTRIAEENAHSGNNAASVHSQFIHGLSGWAGNDEGMFEWDPDAYPSVAVNQALVVQTEIGWNRVCQGFLASEWQYMYAQAAARSWDRMTQQKNWTSTVYSAIFNFFSQAWMEKSGALHGIDQKE